MLHTVNKSPFEKNSLETCLRLSKSGSKILLIEDGVYGALKNGEMASAVNQCRKDREIYALGPDLRARGIEYDELIQGIAVVDYPGFVQLAAESSGVQSWM